MENFLTLYVRYSNLSIGHLECFLFQEDLNKWVCVLLFFSTNSLFKVVKELLKIHKPLPLAIICDLLRVKDMGQRSAERDASISVFYIDSCNLLETKK